MSIEITTEAIEAHQLVVDALANVATLEQKLEQTRRDISRGQPVTAEDLATAKAAVEHAELLIERARGEARRDLVRRLTAEQQAAAVTESVSLRETADLDELLANAVDAVTQLTDAANQQFRLAAKHVDDAEQILDHQGVGLIVRRDGNLRVIRTTETVLAGVAPVAMLGALIATVMERSALKDADLQQAAQRLGSAWTTAQEEVGRGAHRGPVLDEAQRRTQQIRRQSMRSFRYNAASRREVFENQRPTAEEREKFEADELAIKARFAAELDAEHPVTWTVG